MYNKQGELEESFDVRSLKLTETEEKILRYVAGIVYANILEIRIILIIFIYYQF